MFIHGIRPGPMLMVETPAVLYQIVGVLLLSSIAITIYGLSLTRLLVKVLVIPREKLMPVVYVLCVVGSFAIAQRMFDVYVMIAFGLIGFVLREMRYPMAPLVLGIILGEILDVNLRRGLHLSDGDISPFFTRPISLVLFTIIAITILMSLPQVSRRVTGLVKRLDPQSRTG
jgi:putative tricarboxylic transport membrane protein